VTGVQTCALPIFSHKGMNMGWAYWRTGWKGRYLGLKGKT
jgi:hypothetical protein